MSIIERTPAHVVETVRRLDQANKKIYRMELALEDIARAAIMDSVSAIHMRAIARVTLADIRRKL